MALRQLTDRSDAAHYRQVWKQPRLVFCTQGFFPARKWRNIRHD